MIRKIIIMWFLALMPTMATANFAIFQASIASNFLLAAVGSPTGGDLLDGGGGKLIAQ